MKICEYCLEAIRSHGEKVTIKDIHYVDEEDEIESRCEYCEECENDTLYEVEWK